MSLAKVRALIVFGVLSLVALGAVGWAITRDAASGDTSVGCVGTTEVPFPDPDQVTVRVYNATEKPGLASTIADDLKQRGFVIDEVANDSTNRKPVDPAEIRYGPAGAGAAQLMRAYFLGAKTVQDGRADAVIDVVVGGARAEVADESDARAALPQLDRATVACPSGQTSQPASSSQSQPAAQSKG